VRPIPIAFHIWFVEVHTYGIGLAIAFWFGLRYTERRLRKAGYPWQWVTGMFIWVIVGAILGARAMHVIAHYGYYAANPGQIIAIWQGGLSSFGGLIVGIPVGILSTKRRCPELPLPRFADLMGPVLIAAWAVGRILGPQLMRAGGGHRTTAWFGMYYADEVGKRLPVPIFQALEDVAIFGVLLTVERGLRHLRVRGLPGAMSSSDAPLATAGAGLGAAPGAGAVVVAGPGAGAVVVAGPGAGADLGAAPGAGAVVDAGEGGGVDVGGHPQNVPENQPMRPMPPAGIVLGVTLVLYGIERFVNEHLWLATANNVGSQLVQLAGIVVAIVGLIVLATRVGPLRRWYTSPPESAAPTALGPSGPGATVVPSSEPTGEPGATAVPTGEPAGR